MIGFEVAGSCIGSIVGFVSKQLFCYNFLSPIKDRLNELITEVATSRIGAFAGRIVGHELAMIFSIPVTQFLSDFMFGAVKATIETIIILAGRYILQIKEVEKTETLAAKICNVVKKVVSVITFYLSRSYFCHYGMPYVKLGAELLLRHIVVLPSFIPAIGIGYTAAAIAMIAAPLITFFLCDIVGFAAAEASTFLLDRVFSLIGCT